MLNRLRSISLLIGCLFALNACGIANNDSSDVADVQTTPAQRSETPQDGAQPTESLFELFNRPEAENVVRVNRYIWNASLQVLDFLPIQSVDPFTGVIVTGFGTPPGGGTSYRATILIDDPALEARSLNVSLQTRSGAASAATVRAVEDAILTRARQLRIGDSKL
ncbi:MAG: DUF3576 domain-containing protein [Aliishimia sp.]